MLRIVVQNSAAGAKTYYAGGEYYAEGQERAGLWGGNGAERLGLQGLVEKSVFDALCENRNPETGVTLTPRTKTQRRVGYDLNFHVPKSLSILYGLTGDEGLLKAFSESVGVTLRELEREARTRVRRSGTREDRVTGNLLWATFVHTTARPVDGIPDPHLHCHAFVFNATFDDAERRWKAVELGSIKRDASYYEAAFHARLAGRLKAIGYAIRRTAKGWELVGIPERLIPLFSRRTERIEKLAREEGISDARLKDALGARTRERKAKGMSMPELRELWWLKLTDGERNLLEAALAKTISHTFPAVSEYDAMTKAVQHVYERSSVVTVPRLLAAALKFGVGDVTVERMPSELTGHDLIVLERDGIRYATTREILGEEAKLLAYARNGRGRCKRLGIADYAIRREWLGEDQIAAIHSILDSTDRLQLIRGAAGTGKTAMMQEAVERIRENGLVVTVLAPSAEASRGVLRKEGFRQADTLARFLVDARLQARAVGQVIWLDEAGLVGTKSLAALVAIATRIDARLILSGDRRQHRSVERGSALYLLETEAGLVPAELTQIRRQSGKYREAIQYLSAGRVAEGFDRLAALGWVTELPDGEREAALVKEYLEALARGGSVLVLAPTHSESEQVAACIRRGLRDAAMLTGADRELVRLAPRDLTEAQRGDAAVHRAGDVIEFHRPTGGFKAGERFFVEGAGGGSLLVRCPDGKLVSVKLKWSGRFQVYESRPLSIAVGEKLRITRNAKSADGRSLHNGQIVTVGGFLEGGAIDTSAGILPVHFGHWAQAYVSTSHASQGRTVDVVLIAQSRLSIPAASPEQFYVSASRGRHRTMIFTDDKVALRAAIQQTDLRLTASEMVRHPIHNPVWRDWLHRQYLNVKRLAGLGAEAIQKTYRIRGRTI